MADGWICVYRQITKNWLWQDKPFAKGQAFIDLVVNSNYKENKVKIGNEIVLIKRGQTLTSILDLSESWGWSRKKVSNFLNVLTKDKVIEQNRTSKYTLLTVINYDIYQPSEIKKNITGTSKEHQKNTNNKDNKDNNYINNNIAKFEPPKLKEVKNYCLERNNKVNPEIFIDFYTSKNWFVGKNKMKDWKAAVRTWENNRKETVTKPTKNKFNNFKQDGYDFNEIESLMAKKRERGLKGVGQVAN